MDWQPEATGTPSTDTTACLDGAHNPLGARVTRVIWQINYYYLIAYFTGKGIINK
jgi:hypothetical protein